MATSGVLTFHACHNSGVMISPLGEGTYDHMGFFGINGPGDAIIVENWNDSTWVVDSTGARDPAAWDALVNNKYIDASGCSSSGHPRVAIGDYQDADHIASGTLLIWFRASGNIGGISTYNAKLFAYDNTATQGDAPSNVTVNGFEINESGIAGSIENWTPPVYWSSMGSIYNGIDFADHSPNTKYFPDQAEHIWRAAISVRADAVGFLDDWDLVFIFQFA